MNDLSSNFIADKEKAHTDNGMNFRGLLASYQPADIDKLTHNQTLLNLQQLLGDDKLIYIDNDISIDGEFKPTTDTVGIILCNETFTPSNLAIYPLAGQQAGKPFLLHTDGRASAYIIGNEGGQVIATDDLDTATEIYTSLNIEPESYTLITPFEKYQFESMVKAFAKHGQVTIFTDYKLRDTQLKTFKRDNVRLVATIEPIADLLLHKRMAGVLADPETRIDTLGGFEWGTPEPLADDKTKSTPYPLDAFTGVLREAVEAIAHHAQVPTAMAGQCVLGALSTIGQRYINAPIGHSHKPASLYLITEGGTGSGKTEANKLSHHSITQWEENNYKQFIQLQKDWEADRNSLKGAERTHFEATTPKPRNNNMVITDATIESVLDRFIVDDIKNQSWTTDEAGQFLNGHSMKSDTVGNALASLTSVWSGSPVSRLRSQRGNNPQYKTNAYNVRFTLDLQGQREILEPALTDPLMNGQGFLPRCLIACPDSLQGSRVWNTAEKLDSNPQDDPRLQAYWGRCNILLDPLPSEIQTDSDGKEIRFNMPFENRQAMQALADFQQDIEGRQATGKSLEYLRGFASRMAENASRIASLMAFFDCQKSVSVEYLQRAFKLVEYSTAERLRYLDIKPHEKNDSQKLIDWLVSKAKQKNINPLNWSYIFNGCPKPMNKNSKYIRTVLEVLESSNHVRLETQGKATVIYINPILLK